MKNRGFAGEEDSDFQISFNKPKETLHNHHTSDDEADEKTNGALNTGDIDATEERRALTHFDSEEEFKALPEFNLKDKYNYLKRKVSDVIAEKEHAENELAKAKIRWAEAELQKDNIQIKLNQITMKT